MFFNYNNNNYEVIVTKKNNKNLYIRVDEDFNIKVTCPYFYSKNMVEKVINDNFKSICKMIDKQKNSSKLKQMEKNNYLGKTLNIIYKQVTKPQFHDNLLIVKDDDMIEKWYKVKAKEVFKTYLDEAYQVFEENIPYPKLKIRNMKTRWGVCNRKDNSVTLNLELIKKDQEFLNYVIVHELSHFVHFDHGKEFWLTVEKYCPDYKRVRKELKK